MYWLAAVKQTSTAQLLIISLKLKKRACKLRVKKSKLNTENASNGDHFGFGVNSKSKCDERALF